MFVGRVGPLALLAGLLLALSVFAKSFREAQSIVSPLGLVVVLPAGVGLLPGVVLDSTTALIPILNVSLATKHIIVGAFNPLDLLLVFASLMIFAALSLAFCASYFESENVLFRT